LEHELDGSTLRSGAPFLHECAVDQDIALVESLKSDDAACQRRLTAT
jgi:hypothetical protein